MAIRIFRGILVLGLASLLLAGCGSTQQEEEDEMMAPQEEEVSTMDTESQMEEPMEPEVVQPKVSARGNVIVPLEMGEGTEELEGLFYFDFDQAIVKRAGHAELNKHARALQEDRGLRVRLEGHADERGTREYNLALGERRANAIKAYLVAQGASPRQMEVISYGEERPAAEGHNEQAWALNRRVEIVYEE